ncbi:hypothetical protein BDR07DRAFT_1442514 [Suillus spraguei]|nr:hypothetical protein BDR07DRAFT_1442514 [Suillus spraguei]
MCECHWQEIYHKGKVGQGGEDWGYPFQLPEHICCEHESVLQAKSDLLRRTPPLKDPVGLSLCHHCR